MKQQRKKNSVVTGGAQGIGRAIVEMLLERGDDVYLFDRCNEQEVDQELIQSSERLHYRQVDISKSDERKSAFEWCGKDLDLRGERLDCLINNAGLVKDRMTARISEQDWDQVFDVNLKATFFCTQLGLKLMMKQKDNVTRYVIMMSSIVGHTGNIGQAVYAASKAGLLALTKSLAREYASRSLLVNAVAPGLIDTSMTRSMPEQFFDAAIQKIPLKRPGNPQDVAKIVAFLTSGNADFITGQTFDVNGGMLMR